MEETLPEVPCNDPTQFCRLCFSQQNIHWVIRTCGTEVDLPFVNTIGECLGIWLSLEEDFPYAVCRKCTKRLEGIMQFRKTSRRCDAAIRVKRQEDPDALVLFYDYPEDKVFINGSETPGFIKDEPDFEPTMILPEVVLEEEKNKEELDVRTSGIIRMSQAEKQLALKSYMESYSAWSSDINLKKDDDEMTVTAPEALEQEDFPELSVLCEKYVRLDGQASPPLTKQITVSRYTCCFCQQTFRTKLILQGHKLAVHSKKPRKNDFECLDCGKIFLTINQMQGHARRHRRDLMISCQTCGIQFATDNELQAHLKNNGCRLMTFGKCEYCDRTFSRRGRYVFHLQRLHPDKPIPKYEQTRKKSPKANSSSPIEENGRLVVMLAPLSEDVVKAYETTNSNEKLVCTLCYEQFMDLSTYDAHLLECFKQHDDDNGAAPPPPYKLCRCDACTVIFEAIDPFVEHLREHEQPLQIKPHDCVQCSGRKPKFLMHPHSPSMILGD